MARRPREISNSGYYHVYVRGTGGLALFLDDHDHDAFEDLLERTVDRHGVRIHAYCPMLTHHHVLIEAHDGALARAMHLVGTVTAMRLNRRRERFGHVVASRYGSRALHAHNEVAQVALYIAANPVAAGLCDRPEDYRYGTYRATVGIEPAPSWLATDVVPEIFGGTSWFAAACARRARALVALRAQAVAG